MSTIGKVTKQHDGRYVGDLTMLSFRGKIAIVPVKDKASEKHPDYEVYVNSVDVGAGWNRIGKETGLEYVSITIAAPELPKKVYANLGQPPNEKDPNVFNLIYNGK